MELSEQEVIRRESLQKMRDMGIDPYPAAEYVVTGYSTDIKSTFEDDNQDAAWYTGKPVRIDIIRPAMRTLVSLYALQVV